jgi:hypothetical protein
MKPWQITLISFLIVSLIVLIPEGWALPPENRAFSSSVFSSLKAELEKQNPGDLNQALAIIDKHFDSNDFSVKTFKKESDKFGKVVIIGIADAQPRVCFPDFDQQAIVWWDKTGKIKMDQLEMSKDISPIPMPDQVVLGKDEVGMVYNSGYGGNSVNPRFILYRLGTDCCEPVWSSTRNMAWHDTGGTISFPDGTPDKLVIEGSGWLSDCILDHMFEECHIASHRILSATWVRKGDTYIAASWEQAKDTPYNALINFMFGLLTDNDNYIKRYAADTATLNQVKESGFKVTWDSVGSSSAFGKGWIVEQSEPVDCSNNPESSVPCVIIIKQTNIRQLDRHYLFGEPEGSSQLWKVTTICVGGHWKVQSVEKDS